MADNETTLGWLTYPDSGTQFWFSESTAGMGLEEWLQRIELLGIPTYTDFASLPNPADPEVDGAQRQLAAVEDEQTVYRTDGSSWIPWFGEGWLIEILDEEQLISLEGGELVGINRDDVGVTDYNELDNIPEVFPPEAHDHSASDEGGGTLEPVVLRLPNSFSE